MTTETRATLILAASYMGAAGTILLTVAQMLDWPDFVQGFAVGVLLVSLVILLRRKLRDEYFAAPWSSGTSLAFVAVLFWTFILPFFEGFFEGLFNRTNGEDLPLAWTSIVCLLAFFIGFHFKRWRMG